MLEARCTRFAFILGRERQGFVSRVCATENARIGAANCRYFPTARNHRDVREAQVNEPRARKKRDISCCRFPRAPYVSVRCTNRRPLQFTQFFAALCRRRPRNELLTGRKSARLIKNATECPGRGWGLGGGGVMQINDPISRAGFSKRGKNRRESSPSLRAGAR